METEKAISINFTDLNDTPNDLGNYGGHIVAVCSATKTLKFSKSLNIDELVNNAHSTLKGDLNVFGKCNLENDTLCKSIQAECVRSKAIFCDGDMKVNGSIECQGLQITPSETIIDNLKVSKSLEGENIKSSKISSQNMDTETLLIHKDIQFPTEVNIDNLNVKSLKVSETSYLNKVLSTEQTCVSLNSASGLITDFTSTNALIVDMKSTKIESDEIVSGLIHHKTSDIDGSSDQPDIKDLDGGYYQRMINSSKYVWYGKLKTPSKSIKIKINTQTPKVLSQVIPRVSFHIYDLGGLDLVSSFKHDAQIFLNQNDDTSFFINLTFSDNVPLIAKFIFSVVLDKV